jgi:hypothetical protein
MKRGLLQSHQMDLSPFSKLDAHQAVPPRAPGGTSLKVLLVAAAALLPMHSVGHAQDVKKGRDSDKKAAKKSESTSKSGEINPWNRPEGSIVEKSARFYVWYDGNGWHLRSCSQRARRFHGTIKVKDATIKSCAPVGLGKEQKDAWSVDDARSLLKFDFQTSTKSDGLDIRLQGDSGEMEFELQIDGEKRANFVFIGKEEKHPPRNPFTLPAVPEKPQK